MFWRISIFLAITLCVAAASAKERTWTSADGRTMQAEFVREVDGEVTFLKGGKLVTISLEKLSEKDQQVVKDLTAGKEVPEGDAGGEKGPAGQQASGTTEKPAKGKKPLAIQTRTWTDRFGLKSSGKFVRVDGDDVVLSRGARVISVPFTNLSADDQQYVRDVLTSQGKEDEIPSDSLPAATGRDGGLGSLPNAAYGVPDGLPGGSNGGGIAGPAGIGGAPPGGFPGGALPPGLGGSGRGPGISGFPPGGAGAMPPGPGMLPPGISGPGGGIGGGGIAGPMGAGGFPGSGFPGSDPVGGIGGAGAMPPGMAMPPGISGTPGAGMGRMPGMSGSSGYPGIGESGMPGASMPGMTPSFPSSLPEPSFSTPTFETVYSCSGCGRKISQAESGGTSCPYCGITWGFKQDPYGNKTYNSAATSRAATVGVVVVIFVILGGIVFVALFVGIIVAVVKAASSSSRPPPQPQRYY